MFELVTIALAAILSGVTIGILWAVGLWGRLGIWAFLLGCIIGGISLCLAADLTA